MILFIIPKNSGLKSKAQEILNKLSLIGNIIEIRGEDIPCFISKLSKEGKKVIGITGEDLFQEFILSNFNSQLKIMERINWEDENYLFKKPALCLLGPKNRSLEDFNKKIKIAINSKYKELAKKSILNKLEAKGYVFEKIYVNGASEEFFVRGIADLVIDIVCSGKSAEEAGLKVYEKIFESDIVMIKKERSNERLFDLNCLYSKISERIKSNDEKSYTKKLIEDPNLLKRKLIEEAGEVITADSRENLIWECSDLIYFLFVIMAKEEITIKDIEKENERRDKETLINKDKLNKTKGIEK